VTNLGTRVTIAVIIAVVGASKEHATVISGAGSVYVYQRTMESGHNS
jgi:hypothetical protein